MQKIHWALLTLAALLVLPIGISWLRSDTTTASTSAAVHTPSGSVTYVLDWSWGRAQPNADGWWTTSDRGYTVSVSDGYITTHALELVACPHEHPASTSSLSSQLLDLLDAPSAAAGHSSLHHDTSRLTQAWVEPLTAPISQTSAVLTVDEPSYCQLHYLVAADPAAAQPTTTVAITGTYIAPNTMVAVPFSITSDLTWGRNAALASADGIPMHGQQLHIHIQRDLGSLFDGVDFQADADAQAKAILRALTDAVSVSAE